MNSVSDKLIDLSEWYKNLTVESQSNIIQVFGNLNKNIDELDIINELEDNDIKNIRDLFYYVLDSLNEKSKEDVEKELIEKDFDDKLANLIVNEAYKVPFEKRYANIIMSLDDIEFEKITKSIFNEFYLIPYIESWEGFLDIKGINSEVAEAILFFIQNLSISLCSREFGISRSLIDYGFSEIRTKFLLSLIKENIKEVEIIYLIESINNINETLVDLYQRLNYIIEKIEK